jgi:hypothetical protein
MKELTTEPKLNLKGVRAPSVITKVTWHNVLLGGAVWSLRRGQWQPATVIGRGRATCRIRFIDTGNCARRRYEELAGRCITKHGSDRPEVA